MEQHQEHFLQVWDDGALSSHSRGMSWESGNRPWETSLPSLPSAPAFPLEHGSSFGKGQRPQSIPPSAGEITSLKTVSVSH